MNYLAHAYLSFNNKEILTGNIISDFVKGKKQFDFPVSIQTGIKLHRAIDAFTDSHPSTQIVKSFFKKPYGLYSAAFADIVYDFFLANDEQHFSGDDHRLEFTSNTYKHLDEFAHLFPEKFAVMFPYMKTHNWLYNYAYEWGIERSFGGLKRRALHIEETETAFAIFQQNKPAMQKAYSDFFPELLLFSEKHLAILRENEIK